MEEEGTPPGVSDEQSTPAAAEAPQPVEKTEEQQKVEAIFDGVNTVNQQLDGGVAHEVPTKDGSTTLIFSGVANIQPIGYDSSRGVAFGVNSKIGPILLYPEANSQFTGPGDWVTHVPKDIASGERPLDIDDFHAVSNNSTLLEGWEESFTRSKQMVLDNQERMKIIRAQRNAVLDKILDVVSQPVNIDAPPPKV